MRSGTVAVPLVVGLGSAVEIAVRELPAEAVRLLELRERLHTGIANRVPGLRLNGPAVDRLPNTLNLTFPGVLGESMLIALDLEGVEVSMGSACAAGAVEPSHVLRAMGRSVADARSSLRISLGWSNTAEEIDAVAAIIPAVWRRVAAAEPLSEVIAR